MKTRVFGWLCLLLLGSCEKAPEQSNTFTDPNSLPNGIIVEFNKPAARARPVSQTHLADKIEFEYLWQFDITVSTHTDGIEILEFGNFILREDGWYYHNLGGKPFTPENFSNWYDCKSIRIEKGQRCTDTAVWSADTELRATKVVWYFIGLNRHGQKVQGQGSIDILAELENATD